MFLAGNKLYDIDRVSKILKLEYKLYPQLNSF
jgi:hypothetical protein